MLSAAILRCNRETYKLQEQHSSAQTVYGRYFETAILSNPVALSIIGSRKGTTPSQRLPTNMESGYSLAACRFLRLPDL